MRSCIAIAPLKRLRYLASFYRKMSATITRIADLADEFAARGPDEDLR